LVAGLVIGPSGLGYIENREEIHHLSELGVVFLLFIIGIELQPARLWKMRHLVMGLGNLQLLASGSVLTVVVYLLSYLSWEVSLLIGATLALSSTAFVLQLLADRKMISVGYGTPVVAILLMQDMAVVPLLAYVSLLASPGLDLGEDLLLALVEALAILLTLVVIIRFTLNPVLRLLARHGSPEIFTASALLLVLGSALAMERVGLSLAMGGFVAGLLIADSSYRHQIIAEIRPFRGLLLGLFFISMGMSMDLQLLWEKPITILLVTTALMSIKLITILPLAHLFGYRGKAALSVALMLAQAGEFSLVLFALANSEGILEDELFQLLLMTVLFSMLITPLLERLAYRLSPPLQEQNTTEA
ncbi:MAG TPA: potassium transporter KefC, partial [Armatimonadetes bacterium]|nr:potassium transporter KefC [Armatimonadota bacterium]